MTWTTLALIIAFATGTLRALQVWRAQGHFHAINVAIARTLLEGRHGDLPRLLDSSGPSLYVQVARAIVTPTEKLWTSDEATVRTTLEGDAKRACMQASRRLRRGAWLEAVAMTATGLAGVGVLLLSEAPTSVSLGLVAASLLVLANARGARHINVGLLVGSSALVDGIVANLDAIRQSTALASDGAEDGDEAASASASAERNAAAPDTGS